MPLEIGICIVPLTQPLGVLWLVLVLGVVRCVLRGRVVGALYLSLAAGGMNVIGNTKLPAELLATLERPYVVKDLGKLPECDAVVMLGGTHAVSGNDAHGIDFGETADRVMMSVELARLGKGKVLVFGGSGYQYADGYRSEAEVLQRWVAAWKLTGVPVENLGVCRTTAEEGESLAKMVQQRRWRRVLLVSSGWHLRRGVAVVEKLGVSVVPVGCDFQGLSELGARRSFTIFPRYMGFRLMRVYLHEEIGWLYYRLRGWVGEGSKGGG